jgi:hypothetical protein
MKKWQASPEDDIQWGLGLGFAFVLLGSIALLDEQSRKLGVGYSFVGLAHLYNAYRAWRYLPERPPKRYTIRTLLGLMTVIAVALSIIRLV